MRFEIQEVKKVKGKRYDKEGTVVPFEFNVVKMKSLPLDEDSSLLTLKTDEDMNVGDDYELTVKERQEKLTK